MWRQNSGQEYKQGNLLGDYCGRPSWKKMRCNEGDR